MLHKNIRDQYSKMAPDEQMNRKFVSELTALVRNIRAKITMFDYRESGNSNHRVASVH